MMPAQMPQGEWIDCVVDDDYEIYSLYPHIIRRKRNHHFASEFINTNGYVSLTLNGRKFYKHVIVALQFVINDDPEQKTDVDHINHDRTDYHIENLRWCTKSENMKNTSSHLGYDYEFIDDDDIPADLITVRAYGDHEFENYYFSPSMNAFMFWNGVTTRILHINASPGRSPYVNIRDKNNCVVKVSYAKFKKMNRF